MTPMDRPNACALEVAGSTYSGRVVGYDATPARLVYTLEIGDFGTSPKVGVEGTLTADGKRFWGVVTSTAQQSNRMLRVVTFEMITPLANTVTTKQEQPKLATFNATYNDVARLDWGGTTYEGRVVLIDQQVDHFDITSFGDSIKSYASGTPRITITFDVTATHDASPQAKQQATTIKERNTNMNLYEYAVIYTPTLDNGKPDKKNSKVLVQPKTTLSASEASVRTTALREFDADDTLDLDAVKVLVRPFDARY